MSSKTPLDLVPGISGAYEVPSREPDLRGAWILGGPEAGKGLEANLANHHSLLHTLPADPDPDSCPLPSSSGTA